MRDVFQVLEGKKKYDLDLTNFTFVTDSEAVRQKIYQRFAHKKYSFLYDMEKGLDHNFIFSPTQKAKIEAYLLNHLAETEGVVKILDYKIDYLPNERIIDFYFEVATKFGDRIKGTV